MQIQASQTQPSSDDIDLLILVERTVLFLKAYKWIFIIAIVLGIAGGLCRYYFTPTVYRSRLILHSFILTNQNDIQIVSNWNDLRKGGDYKTLAEAFHTTEKKISQVREIKADEIQKVFTPSNPNGFTIDVLVTDNTILPELEKGIVYAFENSPYVKDRLIAKRVRLEELIHKTTLEVGRLDSTKKLMEGILSGHGNSSSSMIIDGGMINRQLIEMNEKLLSFKEELQFTHAVQVLQRFGQFTRPAGPRLLVCLFLGLLISITLAFIITAIHSVNQKIRYRLSKHKASIG